MIGNSSTRVGAVRQASAWSSGVAPPRPSGRPAVDHARPACHRCCGRITIRAARGTPVIRDASSPNLNNATSTKQSVTDATGLIVMASNDVTKRYWHADVALG